MILQRHQGAKLTHRLFLSVKTSWMRKMGLLKWFHPFFKRFWCRKRFCNPKRRQIVQLVHMSVKKKFFFLLGNVSIILANICCEREKIFQVFFRHNTNELSEFDLKHIWKVRHSRPLKEVSRSCFIIAILILDQPHKICWSWKLRLGKN